MQNDWRRTVGGPQSSLDSASQPVLVEMTSIPQIFGSSFVPYTKVHSRTYNNSALCPDLLRLSQIGEADGVRGRIVRGFFKALDRFWDRPSEALRRAIDNFEDGIDVL